MKSVYPFFVVLILFLSPIAWAEEAEGQEDPAGSTPPQTSVAEEDDYDPRVPRYHYFRPAWAVQITGATGAFGGSTDWIRDDSQAKTMAVAIRMDYQPPFLQSLGVLSVGPELAVYPTTSQSSLAQQNGALSVWSIGGQVQYQARFFREQPLVPYAGFGIENVRYRFSNGASSSLIAQGPFFGGAVLLNTFDPSGAAEFYANHGVLRTYVVAEFRSVAGSDSAVNLTGQSLYFGLRTEF